MDIQLLLVPYDSGQRGWRCGAGPEHLVRAGLPAHLQRQGHIPRVPLLRDNLRRWRRRTRCARMALATTCAAGRSDARSANTRRRNIRQRSILRWPHITPPSVCGASIGPARSAGRGQAIRARASAASTAASHRGRDTRGMTFPSLSFSRTRLGLTKPPLRNSGSITSYHPSQPCNQ